MKNIFSYAALGCAIVPFLISILQFVIFSINNRKYKNLLSIYYNSKLELPPLYKFYGEMGFFGSFGMSYFFSRLKKGKKVIFQPKEHSAICKFLSDIDINLTRWLDTYYYLSISALFLYGIFIAMSLMKIIVT